MLKKTTKIASVFVILILLSIPFFLSAQNGKGKNQQISFEEIRSQCANTPFDQRVRVTVARFSVSTRDARGQFGGELATMLSSALQQTNCFRVLESIKNAGDMTEEIAFGASGMTNGGSSPSGGKMLGAQVIITGEITEYNEGKSNVTAFGVSVGSDKARVGFILKVVNPQTREILFSQSVNVLGKKNGFGGMKVLGFKMVGGNSQNQAIADAVEQAILEATSVLVDNKDNIPLPGVNTGTGFSKTYNRNNCAMLANGNAPSVMVIIPEIHIQRRIPDPAGETEIIRKFIEAGFRVIDPSVYDNIRETDRIRQASKNAGQAQQLGREYGADIVIVGEAFSERAGNQANMIACRARVEARAVNTKDATILAAHGTHAGGADITESSSSKVSLANAGSLMADYLLERMCGGVGAGSSGMTMAKGGGQMGTSNTTEIVIEKITFDQFRSIQKTLQAENSVSNVEKSFTGKGGTFRVSHSGSTDDVLDALLDMGGMNLSVESMSDGKLVLSGK